MHEMLIFDSTSGCFDLFSSSAGKYCPKYFRMRCLNDKFTSGYRNQFSLFFYFYVHLQTQTTANTITLRYWQFDYCFTNMWTTKSLHLEIGFTGNNIKIMNDL